MLTPPFKRARSLVPPRFAANAAEDAEPPGCRCGDEDGLDGELDTESESELSRDEPPQGRMRLARMDPHLHCSVIGTCLPTSQLRKLMARFIDVQDADDLQVHHEAVKLASAAGPASKALHKALDQRHVAAVQRFARARHAEALASMWDEALRQGEIPGAYWAALTHREATPRLRQRVFGDVHMLSHLVGAANRADIRRLVSLEKDNADLQERIDRDRARFQAGIEERDRVVDGLRQRLVDAAALANTLASTAASPDLARAGQETIGDFAALVALQTQRRERAEQSLASASAEIDRLREELESSRAHALALGRELSAAEAELSGGGDASALPTGALDRQLRGKRVLYVGGRPSSTPAIRDLVVRHGAAFQRHDGGLEDRKGLLAAGVAWADLVVFPVDCIDHDSANNLKRLCARQGVAFMALRSAAIGSFIAAVAVAAAVEPLGPSRDAGGEPGGTRPICLKHG